jgi:uncharacterized integral membrane protein
MKKKINFKHFNKVKIIQFTLLDFSLVVFKAAFCFLILVFSNILVLIALLVESDDESDVA